LRPFVCRPLVSQRPECSRQTLKRGNGRAAPLRPRIAAACWRNGHAGPVRQLGGGEGGVAGVGARHGRSRGRWALRALCRCVACWSRWRRAARLCVCLAASPQERCTAERHRALRFCLRASCALLLLGAAAARPWQRAACGWRRPRPSALDAALALRCCSPSPVGTMLPSAAAAMLRGNAPLPAAEQHTPGLLSACSSARAGRRQPAAALQPAP
jgi:hypothetical protein